MRCGLLIMLLLGLSTVGVQVEAATGRVLKVLPLYVDREGRVAPSPSLFDRDAYQAELRRDPRSCSGLRFDVQWKAKQASPAGLRLRLELVTTTANKDRAILLEAPVRAKTGWSRWSQMKLQGEAFRNAGELIAWRASLWDGAQMLAEQKSFLW